MINGKQRSDVIQYITKTGIFDFILDCIDDPEQISKLAISCINVMTDCDLLMDTNAIPFGLRKLLTSNSQLKFIQTNTDLFTLLSKIFTKYSGTMDLFLDLSTIENLFIILAESFTNSNSDFNELSKVFLSYLSSKQVYRPFPMQVFLTLIRAYEIRLKILLKNQNWQLLNKCTKKLFDGKHDYAILFDTILIQLHLHNLAIHLFKDFLQDENELENLKIFNEILNSIYFTLPLNELWRCFSSTNQASVCLHNMLLLSQHVLKKGFNNFELIEICSLCWPIITTYPDLFRDTEIKNKFNAFLPLLMDAITRILHYYVELQTTNTRFSTTQQICPTSKEAQLVDELSQSSLQLACYALASGLVSFQTRVNKNNEIESCANNLNEMEQEYFSFWKTVINGINHVPGASLSVLCKRLNDFNNQPLKDLSNEVNLYFPTVLAIIACLINRNHYNISIKTPSNDSSLNLHSVESDFISKIIPCLSESIIQTGVEYFKQLPVLFSIELLASFAISKSLNVQLSTSEHKALNILGNGLANRLQLQHTFCLLSIQCFSSFLLQGDPVWIIIAQKMIYHCHLQCSPEKGNILDMLPMTYEFVSLIWSVWFSFLFDLEKQEMVQRLGNTFAKCCLTLRTETNADLSGELKLASYIAEHLSSLPTQIDSIFLQNDLHQENFIFLLRNVAQLEGIFTNRACLFKVVETILLLITNKKYACDNHLPTLLSILNLSILKAEKEVLSKVGLFVKTELQLKKPVWLFVEGLESEKDSNLPFDFVDYCTSNRIPLNLLEEIMCLVAMLIDGGNEFDQSSMFEDNAVYTPIYEIPSVILWGLGGSTVSLTSERCFCASAFFLLTSTYQLLSMQNSLNSQQFFDELITSINSSIIDVGLKNLRLLFIALFGKTLNMAQAEAIKLGSHFDNTVWILIIIDFLKSEEYDEAVFPIPCALIVFLTELLMNSPSLTILAVDEKLLEHVLIFYAQHNYSTVHYSNDLFHLQRLIFQICQNKSLDTISKSAKECLLIKLKNEGFSPTYEHNWLKIRAYERFLMPTLQAFDNQ